MFFWNWLTRKTTEALVKGFENFARAVTPDGEEPPADLAQLRERALAGTEPKQLAAAPAEADPPADAGRKPKRAG